MKKWGEGANQNCPHKEGGWSKGKGGGGLERFHILRGVGQKEGVTIRKVGVLDLGVVCVRVEGTV